MLISAKSRRENIDYMRWVVLLKAFLLDRTDQKSVNEFNDTVQRLMELQTPGTKKKIKTPEDVKKIMQDFKVAFPKFREKKLKNFKKAD